MGKQYLIDELPEEFRDNEYDTDIPVGVYFNPKTGNLVIQIAEHTGPSAWALCGRTPEEAPIPPSLKSVGDMTIDTRPAGYPIDDIVKIIEAART